MVADNRAREWVQQLEGASGGRCLARPVLVVDGKLANRGQPIGLGRQRTCL